LEISGLIDVITGRIDAGIADLQHAVKLDPLNANSYHVLGFGSYLAHRYQDAHAANAEAISLDTDLLRAYEYVGLTDYQLGKFEAARATCEVRPTYWGTQWCLALTYEKLGRHTDAQGAVSKIRAMQGDAAAYQYAAIYAQWGDNPKALEWLETAMRLRDPGFSYIRRDPLMDPLRKEPRYRAIEQKLNFPD
jgi:tetratricopeptide (TPR) repeat protein